MKSLSFCVLAVLLLAVPAPADCRETAKLTVAGHEMVITLQEADRIRRAVEKYLAEEKPPLEPSVVGPGEVFIDDQGTVRMGAWILESGGSDAPELRLTFRVLTNEHFIVRQIVTLRQEGGQWVVKGTGRETAHLRKE